MFPREYCEIFNTPGGYFSVSKNMIIKYVEIKII